LIEHGLTSAPTYKLRVTLQHGH